MDFSEWRDADYYSLQSQATVNSLASLKSERNTRKYLVSSMESQFASVEYLYLPSEKKITPLMKGIQFSNLPMPGDAEVIGISVFERLHPKKGLVVGVTYIITMGRQAKEELEKQMRLSPLVDESRDPNSGKESPDHSSPVISPFTSLAASPLTSRETSPVSSQTTSPETKATDEHQEPLLKSQALNIYSANVDDDSIDPYKLESIAENCQSITLSYIPFCLKTTVVEEPNGEETPVFLISGSDSKIYLYKESSEQEKGQPLFVEEMSVGVVFPEFENLQGIVETLEIAKPSCDRRVTALGFQEGSIEVFHVSIKTLEILHTWKTSMDGPITSLHFFTQCRDVPCPPPLKTVHGDEEEKDPDKTNLHLLMTVHLQPALVYRDILHKGLSEVLPLYNSEKFDSCLCSLAMDVDFDGENEVIVGTYGQELLVYKFFAQKDVYMPVSPQEAARPASPSESGRTLTPFEEFSKHRHKSAESSAPEKTQDPQRKVKSQENLLHLSPERGQDPRLSPERIEGMPSELRTVTEPNYRLQSRRSFPFPIMALSSGDMMGDGVENLAVLTSFGIHILQPDINKLMDIVTERLNQYAENAPVQEAGDEFHRLQLE